MNDGGHGEAFRAAPVVPSAPDRAHALATRRFQGIPSVAVTPGGRLWATWYAGKTPAEDHNNYVVVATSGDNGNTWSECLIIDPDGEGPVRAFDPELWIDPHGRLWSFWTQTVGHSGSVAGVWAVTRDDPDSASAEWSPPRRLTDGVMMCKPVVLTTGEWLLPASTWRETDHSARVIVSTDSGRTWQLRGASHVPKEVRSFDEHMIVERTDGDLWMLVRTAYGIGESRSADRGRTWSALQPSPIRHPSARFFVTRLRSGSLLLVKHGPIRTQTGRSHLTAYASRDEGATWSTGLLLDERDGVSYPDGQQDAKGIIHVVHDRDRTGAMEILLSQFSEDDVWTGRAESGHAALGICVSRGC